MTRNNEGEEMLNKRAIQCRCLFQALRELKRLVVVMIIAAGLPLIPAAVHGQVASPLTLDQVRSLLSIGAPDATIANEIASRGVAFRPSLALLAELERDGAGDHTLAALRKLIPAERTICESFGGGMSGGQHAFHDKKWGEAKEYFEQAATISPNSGQAWNSLGEVYLALQQTQAAYSAWDKVLNSGDAVALTACMENGQPVCEGGTLRLTPTTLFRYKGDQKIFEVPLSAVQVIGTIHHGWPSYLSFEVLVSGTKYDFDFFPIAVNCVWTGTLVCPTEGKAEQTAMGSYFDQTIHRLTSGETKGTAIAPPVEKPIKADIPPVKIQVAHRHRPVGGGFLVPNQITYCQGILTVTLGVVEYDCTVPDRSLGRCEHGVISPIRSAEYKGGGDLKIVGRGGNWDFFGNGADLKRAYDAIVATSTPQRQVATPQQ